MSSQHPDCGFSDGDTTPASGASMTPHTAPSPPTASVRVTQTEAFIGAGPRRHSRTLAVAVAAIGTAGAGVVAVGAGSEEPGVRIAASSSTTPESTTPVEPPPPPPPAVAPPTGRPAPAPRVRGRVGSARPATPRAPGRGSLSPSAETVANWSAATPAPSGDVRVVARGESLWSIAAELAGNSASARRIASVTGDLWTLNAAAIGTGSPNTVFVGTRLRLPERS